MIGPLRTAFHRQLRRRAGHLAGRIVPHLPTGATVLDIGSGTGHNAEALRARGARTCVEADVDRGYLPRVLEVVDRLLGLGRTPSLLSEFLP